MDKIREKLRPIYKDFATKYLKPFNGSDQPKELENLLSFQQLKRAMKELLGDNITEHEIITVARRYRAPGPTKRHARDVVL